MEKKKYIKPNTNIVQMQCEGFICMSYGVEDRDGSYIISPSVAGDTEWYETDDEGKGGITGDLD